MGGFRALSCSKLAVLLLLLNTFTSTRAHENQTEIQDTTVYSAAVETCGGWRLNKLPEVKAFIKGDLLNKFQRTEYKKIPGKSPEMVFYNAAGEELERYSMEGYTEAQLTQFFIDKGIPLKSTEHDEM